MKRAASENSEKDGGGHLTNGVKVPRLEQTEAADAHPSEEVLTIGVASKV